MIACRKPIVSAINGVAVGGGLAIALLADISIASERAILMDGHIKPGLVAGDHAALVWPLAIGLVGKCVPHEELMPAANGIAVRLARGPQFAIQATKAALNDWYLHNIGIFEHSLYVEAHSMTLPDAEVGIAAVRGKSEPEFPGAVGSHRY